MATLVVPSQHEEGGGETELQGPQVEHTLERDGGGGGGVMSLMGVSMEGIGK